VYNNVIKARVQDILNDLNGNRTEGNGPIDPEVMENTAQRVADAYEEMFCGYGQDPKAILARVFDSTTDEMVSVLNIPVFSTCEHHMLPFIGKAHVAYIPDGKIVGISKIPRVIECFARRLQLQERLTNDVADAFMQCVKPKGMGIIITAEHTCMTTRGVNKPGTRTVTSAMRGIFKDDDKTRNEFLELIKIGGGA
jgi:GTP cyclohydrolase I